MEVNFTTEKSKKMAENLWFSVYTEQNLICALQSIDYFKKIYQEVSNHFHKSFPIADIIDERKGIEILNEIKELISTHDKFNESTLKKLKNRIVNLNEELQKLIDSKD